MSVLPTVERTVSYPQSYGKLLLGFSELPQFSNQVADGWLLQHEDWFETSRF